MATSKEYAYYIKGNKVAIIEKDWALSGGQTLSQPGLNDLGSTDGSLWKSPKASITDGLEIQYTYSPQYMLAANHTINTNKFYISGWTVIGGYLTFLRSSILGTNWTSSPYNAVTSGSLGHTGGDDSDYIVVKGSSRWNGLHKVQTKGTEGQLVTYTKVNEVLPYWEDQNIDYSSLSRVSDGGGNAILLYLADHFSVGDYVWLSGNDGANNNGLFYVNSISQSTTSAGSYIWLGTQYYVSSVTSLATEASRDNEIFVDTGESDINIHKAYRDFCYILTDVNVLNDEADELDLPRYQANAVVQYVKSRYLEDAGNVEMKEYYMREFRRMIEKHESGKKRGVYRTQGFGLFR